VRLSAEMFSEIVDALRSDRKGDRDQRIEPRVGMAGEATLVSICEDGKRCVSRVRIRDISRGGIGLCSSTKFNKDQRVIIQLLSVAGDPIWLICVAAHCRRLESDRFSIGARIQQVMRADKVRRVEAELGRAAVQLLLDPEARASAARISKAILA
jgi:hypothetical protein